MEKVENKEQDVKQIKNPAEYAYRPSDEVKVTGELFNAMRRALDLMLQDETKVYYPEQYKFVYADGKDVSKEDILNDREGVQEKVAKGEVSQVVDVNGTMLARPLIFRTEKGMEILRIKQLAEQLHLKFIDDGSAVHLLELQREFQELSNGNEKFQLKKEE